ncbi:Ubiquitin carboxyl-terminal hydrolase [Meloidogyne graminicola]|uniref:ubiquitinyl hydrolase 1 n=1 Tax=Meloidogyne graminicola TaxID=189291 RepID=A0A8S9ZSL0_9BILA|nr:Ubiquitin carboxyl-terminal hydrolase [Meloidogyne graminicola]
MNSALQSLANVSTLTEYFLNNEYDAEINEQNPLGTQGRLVRAYANFLRILRSGQAQAVNPLPLKTASEAWNIYKQRNNSIIVDLFHGQTKLQDGIKHSSITKLPNILIIHLKRFRHEGNYNTKLRTKITFPLYDLDMAQFVLSEERNEDEEKQLPNCYDLIGLISHRGQNIEYGHYVAYCRNISDGNWYEFDDAQVTRVSPHEVANQEPYVLFYERRNSFCENHGKEDIEYKEIINEEQESIDGYNFRKEIKMKDNNDFIKINKDEEMEINDDNYENDNLQQNQLQSSSTITSSDDCSPCCLQQKN